ncbi:hypothetical protein DyAD56_23540 [Dyella sp. AD56]|nr:hypothetical protein DyAD56_23540 [Dyella sp. AD56]
MQWHALRFIRAHANDYVITEGSHFCMPPAKLGHDSYIGNAGVTFAQSGEPSGIDQQLPVRQCPAACLLEDLHAIGMGTLEKGDR